MENSNWLMIVNVAPVRNEAGAPRRAEVWIDGIIGGYDWFDGSGVVAAQFIRTIDAMGLKAEDQIGVRINTPGGVVSDGVTITNYLINHPASVDIRVEGQAASIGSVICMAADPGKLHMGLGATMFIHDPWTLVAGNADQMRKAADTLDKVRDSIVAIYQRRTSLSAEEIKTLMRDETTMTAEEAVSWGFADDMDANIKVAACVNMSDVLAQVRAQLNTGTAPAHPREVNDMSGNKDLPELSREVLAAKYPDLLSSIRTEGATAERTRIQAVLAQSLPGHEKLVQELAFDGKTTGPEAAVAVLNAEKAARGNALATLKTEAHPPLPQPALPDGDGRQAADDSAAAFEADVEARMKTGLSRGKAMAAAAKENPKAHAAWVAKQNGGKQ